MQKIILNRDDVYAILEMARISKEKVGPITINHFINLLLKLYDKSEKEDDWQYLVKNIIAEYDEQKKKLK